MQTKELLEIIEKHHLEDSSIPDEYLDIHFLVKQYHSNNNTNAFMEVWFDISGEDNGQPYISVYGGYIDTKRIPIEDINVFTYAKELINKYKKFIKECETVNKLYLCIEEYKGIHPGQVVVCNEKGFLELDGEFICHKDSVGGRCFQDTGQTKRVVKDFWTVYQNL